jgi:hypothetical protein
MVESLASADSIVTEARGELRGNISESAEMSRVYAALTLGLAQPFYGWGNARQSAGARFRGLLSGGLSPADKHAEARYCEPKPADPALKTLG